MPYFVVQEHHSKKLHFDLRLEMSGVLKSFAIPKGPSLNPKDKRLAIEVADHPLSYGDFEGIIPEGYYGAGYVVIWDKGSYELIKGSLEEGIIELKFNGEILKGYFVLKQLKDGKEWLFFKKKDKFANENFKIIIRLTEEEKMRLKEVIPPCEIY